MTDQPTPPSLREQIEDIVNTSKSHSEAVANVIAFIEADRQKTKQAILAWHQRQLEQAEQLAVTKNKQEMRDKYESLCGCPMCEHHTYAYKSQAHQPKPEGDNDGI